MFDLIIAGYRTLFLLIAGLTGVGWAIVVLSFLCSLLMIPLMRAVAGIVARETEYQNVILPQIAAIKEKYASDIDRNMRIQALYSRYSYSPVSAVKKVLPLFVQIPFLLLTYFMLKGTSQLSGVSFLFLKDLGAADALLNGVNLLPFVMTGVNLITVFATPGFTRRDMTQAIGIALLFLVMLYTAPSALLLYWTLNNAITCIRTLTAKRFEGLRLLEERVCHIRIFPDVVIRFVLSNIRRADSVKISIKDSFFSSLFFAASFFVVMPLQSYIMALEMFDFSLKCLLIYSCFRMVIAILVLFAPFFLGSLFLGAIFRFLVLAFVICAFVEAGPLSYGLPELNGEFTGYDLAWRSVFDLFVLLFVFCFVVKKRQNFPTFFYFFFIGILFCTPLLARLNRDSRKQSVSNKPEMLETISRATVINELKFSPKRNIIVIVLDSISVNACKDAIKRHPCLEENLSGFIHFCNNLGMAWRTPPAIAGLLTGEYWNPEKESFADYVGSVFSDRSVLWDAKQRNWSVFMSAGQGSVGYTNIGMALKETKSYKNPFMQESNDLFALTVDQIMLFRVVPYWMKENYIRLVSPYFTGERNVHKSITHGAGFSDFKNDVCLWPFISESPIDDANHESALHIIHTDGGHPPVRFDYNGNRVNKKGAKYEDYVDQCAYVLKLAGNFFNRLKSRGIYDSSTIILCADHSVLWDKKPLDALSLAYPFLMVKAAYSKDELKMVEVPTSHSRIADLIRRMINKDLTSEEIISALRCENRFCRDVHSPRIRDYYVSSNGVVSVKEGGDSEPSIKSLKPLQFFRNYDFNPDTAIGNYPDFRVEGGSRSTGQGIENLKGIMDLWVRLPITGSVDRISLKIVPLKSSEENVTRIIASGKFVDVIGRPKYTKEMTLTNVMPDDEGVLKITFENPLNVCNCMVLKSMTLWPKKDEMMMEKSFSLLSAAKIRRATYLKTNADEILKCVGKLDRGWADGDLAGYIAKKEYIGARIRLPRACKARRLIFDGKRESGHGQYTVVSIDKKGNSTCLVQANYADLDFQWHSYLVDLPDDAEVLIFNGGYTDRSGSKDSCYLFKNVRLIE